MLRKLLRRGRYWPDLRGMQGHVQHHYSGVGRYFVESRRMCCVPAAGQSWSNWQVHGELTDGARLWSLVQVASRRL